MDLLAKMLEINPEDRPYASELLQHEIFKNQVMLPGLERLSNGHDGEQTENDLEHFHQRYLTL